MYRLARVLFQMQPLDTDLHGLAVNVDLDLALTHDRLLVLADLISLRQIGIEIVLTIKHTFQIDRCLNAQPRAHGLCDAFGIDDGQHAGHRRIDKRDMTIRSATERGRGAREKFRRRGHLRVHLQADDDLPLARRTFDEVGIGGGLDLVLHGLAPFESPRYRRGPSIAIPSLALLARMRRNDFVWMRPDKPEARRSTDKRQDHE